LRRMISIPRVKSAMRLAACSLLMGMAAASTARAQTIPGRYIVELHGEPSLKESTRLSVVAGQQRLKRQVEASGGRILGSATAVLNALFIEATDEQAAALARDPDVARVVHDYIVKAALNRALPLHRVDKAWQLIGGSAKAGAGVRIAILDTGVDQTHPGFAPGSLSAPAGFPKASPSVNSAYTNPKVIVARSYREFNDPAGYGEDASDRAGHGTPIAFAAAGIAQPLFGTLSGVAPQAWVGNYKVLGDNEQGAASGIIQGIDDAVRDGMQVLNLSFGTAIGQNASNDPQIAALERAAAQGVIVVAAAGNDGPDANTIFSPGSAPSAIAVGASRNERTLDDLGREIATDARRVSTFSARGPNSNDGLKPDLVAVGQDLVSADSTLRPGSTGFSIADGTSFSTGIVAGAAALLMAAKPGLSEAQYRSLLINSSSPLVFGGLPAAVLAAGAGRLDVNQAVSNAIVASPTALRLGAGGGTINITAALRLENLGPSVATLDLSVEAFDVGIAPIVSPNIVTIPPRATAQIQVRLSGAALNSGSLQGWIVATGGGSSVRVPYWYGVRSSTVSSIMAVEIPRRAAPSSQVTVHLRTLDAVGLPLDGFRPSLAPLCGGASVVRVDSPGSSSPLTYSAVLQTGSLPGVNAFRVTAGTARRYLNFPVGGTASSPSIAACGVGNAGSFQGGDVAPGSVISIFGTGFEVTADATTVPLPLELAGVSVQIDGRPAPLFAVRPGQINAQVPYETPLGETSVIVRTPGGSTPPAAVTISAAAPGIFQFQGDRAVAVNQDGSVNTEDHPAPVGSAVVVYLTGHGPLDNTVPTGAAAPLDTFVRLRDRVTATIGGRVASIFFAGLTPGSVGLMQANLTIPGMPAGTYPLRIRIGDLDSQEVLISVR